MLTDTSRAVLQDCCSLRRGNEVMFHKHRQNQVGTAVERRTLPALNGWFPCIGMAGKPTITGKGIAGFTAIDTMAGFPAIIAAMKTQYILPTVKQIPVHWDVKPIVKVVALVIRETAEDNLGNPMSEKEYNHMSQQEGDDYDKERNKDAKFWRSARKLAELTKADREAVNHALDVLQKGKFVDSDRPLGKLKHRGN